MLPKPQRNPDDILANKPGLTFEDGVLLGKLQAAAYAAVVPAPYDWLYQEPDPAPSATTTSTMDNCPGLLLNSGNGSWQSFLSRLTPAEDGENLEEHEIGDRPTGLRFGYFLSKRRRAGQSANRLAA